MEAEKKMINERSVPLEKPNYMLMSLQRIVVIAVILASVIVVVYYTPMPGSNFRYYFIENALKLMDYTFLKKRNLCESNIAGFSFASVCT